MKDERITEIGIAPRPASDFWFACVDIEVVRDPELSPIDKTVFAVICSHAGTTTRQSLLKVKTIAAEAGCSDRSVQRSLRALEERGVVETCPRSMDGHRIASIYRIVGHRAPCYAAAPAPKAAPQLPLIEPEEAE
ncbi:MAG: helix-turn-helix domain-containing protein, partial [Synergistaceae bacterium]|nr:helix-turn-helix domain-containing protein [Synergistaceae bacterium]